MQSPAPSASRPPRTAWRRRPQSARPAAMRSASSCSVPAAVVRRQTQRTMLAVPDEGGDLRDSGILARERLHTREPGREDAGALKELLIEGADGRQPLAREIAPPHADDVEALEHGVLAVDQPERNDVAAHAANAADHH